MAMIENLNIRRFHFQFSGSKVTSDPSPLPRQFFSFSLVNPSRFRTNERVEAGKYARVMTKQLETFLSLSSDAASATSSNDFSSIRNVLAAAKKEFLGLMTDEKYEFKRSD